jgi:hypothetical protein
VVLSRRELAGEKGVATIALLFSSSCLRGIEGVFFLGVVQVCDGTRSSDVFVDVQWGVGQRERRY